MKRENIFIMKVVFGAAAAIIAIGLLFFNINNLVTWMTLNDPFQGQWTAVQLSNGEIVYGHLAGVSGSVVGLKDVYVLDKVTPVPSVNTVSSGDGLTIGGTVTPADTASPKLIPVSDTPRLFINRSAIIYFKFVDAGDPALPYLH